MALRYEEMMKTKKFLPGYVGYVNEEHTEKAKKELNETDENRGRAILAMRELILKEKNITYPTDDAYLLQYLRARKFDVKKAFNLFLSFYRVKKDYPECFTEFDYEKLNILARSGAGTYLPYRSLDGCAILVLEFNKWDCEKNDIIDVMRMLAILLLHAAEDPATQVCGLRVLINVKGATFRQIRCITPRYIHLFSKALRNCIPIRFKGIHIYNESAIFQYVWSILKIFLTEKINKRVHFHGDNQKQLHKFIAKEVLTEDYGGCNKYFNQGDWCVKMLTDLKPKLDIIIRSGFKK